MDLAVVDGEAMWRTIISLDAPQSKALYDMIHARKADGSLALTSCSSAAGGRADEHAIASGDVLYVQASSFAHCLRSAAAQHVCQ